MSVVSTHTKCVFSEFVFGACLCAPFTGVLFLSQLEAEFDKKKMLEAVSLVINLSYIVLLLWGQYIFEWLAVKNL